MLVHLEVNKRRMILNVPEKIGIPCGLVLRSPLNIEHKYRGWIPSKRSYVAR